MISYPWKSEIEHALDDEIVSINGLPGGLTNSNFLVSLRKSLPIVVRVPAPHNTILFNYGHENYVLNLVKPLEIDVELLYFNPQTGIKCTRYVSDTNTFALASNWTSSHLINLSGHLRKLHSVPTVHVHPFNPVGKYEQYKKDITALLHLFPEQKIIDSIKELYKKHPLVLCHNDLVPGNILVNSTKLYLIDYEYAAGNIALFDLVSLINENNRTYDDPLVTIFLETYLGKSLTTSDRSELIIMDQFQCLLWHHWANRLYDLTHEIIYRDIAVLKYQRYLTLK